MSAEFFTTVDVEAAKKHARAGDAHLRADREGVEVVDFGSLVDDMVRFIPEEIDGERREGYIEAIRDLFMHVSANILEHDLDDGRLTPSFRSMTVPISRVDDALKRRNARAE